MKRRRFLSFLLPFLVLNKNGKVDRQVHSSKARFNQYYRFHDRDRDRQLSLFHVHGEPVMAYSRKDAIKRWVHVDLKNRRRRTRR